MECCKCGKDMETPLDLPKLGLFLGFYHQDIKNLPEGEVAVAYREYIKKQFGKYQAVATGFCCECILDALCTPGCLK